MNEMNRNSEGRCLVCGEFASVTPSHINDAKPLASELARRVEQECNTWPMGKLVSLEPLIVKFVSREVSKALASERARVRRIVKKLRDAEERGYDTSYYQACNDILAALSRQGKTP